MASELCLKNWLTVESSGDCRCRPAEVLVLVFTRPKRDMLSNKGNQDTSHPKDALPLPPSTTNTQRLALHEGVHRDPFFDRCYPSILPAGPAETVSLFGVAAWR
jgi:hypothetical protein